MAETRPLRVCDVCGGVDDHPRHVVAHAPGSAPAPNATLISKVAGGSDLDQATKDAVIADLLDTSVQLRHLDCCASDGCPDGSCAAIAETHEDLKGDKLVKHLTSGAVDDIGTRLNDERHQAAQEASA